MHECNTCDNEKENKKEMPNINIYITYNDCRVETDESTYIDNVKVDSEE